MSVMKIKISEREVNLASFVAAALYISCWFLPIIHNEIGYYGAELSHKEFWKLLTDCLRIAATVRGA